MKYIDLWFSQGNIPVIKKKCIVSKQDLIQYIKTPRYGILEVLFQLALRC